MVRLSCLLTCLLGALFLVLPAAAYPSANNYYRDGGEYEPEDVDLLLSRLNQLIQMERKVEKINNDISSEKRALDMGLNRGYSGAVQAKHLMALAAANFAGGPGRRRRNAAY